MIVSYTSEELHLTEPGLEAFDAGTLTLDRRRLGPCPSGLLPHLSPREFGMSASCRDQISQCMHSIAPPGFFWLTCLYECANRKARAFRVALYKMRIQTTFCNTGHK
jgi:hypothetical protein